MAWRNTLASRLPFSELLRTKAGTASCKESYDLSYGGLHICRFYFSLDTSLFLSFWRDGSSLPVWEERSGLKDVDDPKETFRCQSFFAVYTVPLCTYLLD